MSDKAQPPRHDLRWLADADGEPTASIGDPPAPGTDAWGMPQGTPPLGGTPPLSTAPLSTVPPAGQQAWAPPAGPHGQPVYVAQPPGSATVALVLGIVSLVLCGPLLGIPAWIVGVSARRESRQLPGQPGHGMATAGMVLGIVGTFLWLVGWVLYAVLIAGIFAAAESWSSYDYSLLLPGVTA